MPSLSLFENLAHLKTNVTVWYTEPILCESALVPLPSSYLCVVRSRCYAVQFRQLAQLFVLLIKRRDLEVKLLSTADAKHA